MKKLPSPQQIMCHVSLLLSLASSPLFTSAQDAASIDVQIPLNESINKLWIDIPDKGLPDNDRFHVLTQEPVCASEAMRKFKYMITEVMKRRAMYEALKMEFKLIELLPVGEAVDVVAKVAELATEYWADGLSEDGFVDAATGKLGEEVYDNVAKKVLDKVKDKLKEKGSEAAERILTNAVKQLYQKLAEIQKKEFINTVYEDAQCGACGLRIYTGFEFVGGVAKHYLYFDAWGDCQCKWPTNVPDPMKLRDWHIWGKAPITIGNLKKVNKKYSFDTQVGAAEYFIMANCGCSTNTTTGTGYQPPVKPIVPDGKKAYERICDNECDPLYQALIKASGDMYDAQQALDRLNSVLTTMERKVRDEQEKIDGLSKRIADFEKNINDRSTDIEGRARRGSADNSPAGREGFNNYIKEQRGKIAKDREALEKMKADLERIKRRKADLEKERDRWRREQQRLQTALDEAKRKRAEAEKAYEDCLERCYRRAASSGNPNDRPTIGTDDNEHQRKAKEKVLLGATAAVSFRTYNFRNESNSNDQLNTSGIGFALGLYARLPVSDKVSFQAMLYPVQMIMTSGSNKVTEGTGTNSFTRNSTNGYRLFAPSLSMHACFELGTATTLLAGPSFMLPLSASVKSHGTTTTTVGGNTITSSFGNNSYSSIAADKKLSVSLEAGISQQVRMAGKDAALQLIGTLPLTNALGMTNMKNKVGGIGIGLQWPLGK